MGDAVGSGSGLLEPGSTVRQQISIDDLVSKAEQVGPSLTLRELQQGGDFLNVITCKPGEVTVLSAERGSGISSFRQALLQPSKQSSIAIRFGSQELLPSEIHVVGQSRRRRTEPTVSAVLQGAGARVRVVPELLDSVGLRPKLKSSPQSLTDCEYRRLEICCSFFSPAKVILFDKPFEPIDDQFIETVARVMLEAVQATMRIFVVTEYTRLPQCWEGAVAKGSPTRSDDELATLETSSGQTNVMMRNMRSMMENNRPAQERGGFFVTRPQMIHAAPTGTVAEETLGQECIANPEMSADIEPSVLPPEEEKRPETPSRITTDHQRSLTHVSPMKRWLRHSNVIRWLYRKKMDLKDAIRARNAEHRQEPLLSARLQSAAQRYESSARLRRGVNNSVRTGVISFFVFLIAGYIFLHYL